MIESERKRLTLTAEVFKAIGHPDRLAMLEQLAEQKWCVCDLAASLNMNKSVASKHLSLLYDMGLLEMERKGTQVIYSLAAPCVIEMGKCTYLAILSIKKNRLEA